jgi:hypothetical protein
VSVEQGAGRTQGGLDTGRLQGCSYDSDEQSSSWYATSENENDMDMEHGLENDLETPQKHIINHPC